MQNRNSVHLFLARISPPNSARMPPEFGGGGGGAENAPPPQLGPVLQTRKNARQNFRPYFFASRRTNEFGRGGGGKFGRGGVEQARSILKKTPVQNFQKKYFGNSARRGKCPGGKGNERHLRTCRPDNWIIPLGGEQVHLTRAMRRGGAGAFWG